jgi:hypothetical protein
MEMAGDYRCSATDFSARSPRMGSLSNSPCAVLMIIQIQAPKMAASIRPGKIGTLGLKSA